MVREGFLRRCFEERSERSETRAHGLNGKKKRVPRPQVHRCELRGRDWRRPCGWKKERVREGPRAHLVRSYRHSEDEGSIGGVMGCQWRIGSCKRSFNFLECFLQNSGITSVMVLRAELSKGD